MRVWASAELIGKNRIERPMLVNSLSDLVILTEEVAEKIEPKYLGYDVSLRVGGGGEVKGKACLITVRVKDEKGEAREAEVEAAVLKGEENCTLGHEALTKLGIKVDFKIGRIEFV
jgi:predicted aspartyl protease